MVGNITCKYVNNMAFGSQDQLAEWIKSGTVAGGEAPTIDRTLRLSVPIHKIKMSLVYARPSRE